MEFPSMWRRRVTTRLEWILKKTCAERKRFSDIERRSSLVFTAAIFNRFYFDVCTLAHASAAATLREIAGCDWKNHSTHRAGDRSARFCSASLFIDEMNGSTLAMERNA